MAVDRIFSKRWRRFAAGVVVTLFVLWLAMVVFNLPFPVPLP